MPQIAEVLLDVANRRLNHSYHYSIPAALTVHVGTRVLVPLQKRQVQGVVIGLSDQAPAEIEVSKLRPIAEALDAALAVPTEMIELAHWLARTTVCSVAQCLHTVWPLLQGKTEEWVIPLVDLQDADVQAMRWLDEDVYRAVEVLHRSRRKALPLKVLEKRAGLTAEAAERLISSGWIKRESRFTPRESGGKTGTDRDNGRIKGRESGKSAEFAPEDVALTAEQRQAVAKIKAALDERKGKTLLLHGVTGSGKTEVYKRVVRQVIASGGDAILLVPEITLTSQLAQIFKDYFGDQVAVLHSGLAAGSKSRIWAEIAAGKKHLVIGARSAVFAPLPHLRLIILDEEHDGAYKQDENPKYHTREVARWRMERCRGVVLLGSATPSLETYAAAQNGKIELISMPSRISKMGLPPVTVVDMRAELLNGNRSVFSLPLQVKLKEKTQRGEQAMIFLNRRGYSTFVVCRECGYVVECPNCAVALTYHAAGQVMRCHYCNHEEAVPHRCPSCQSKYIRFFGQGTQRVEEELNALLPEIPVLRMDSDTMRAKDSHQLILERFRRQEAGVLVGTQMMAKGLDFPNVTLVGVMAADQILNMPDFRSRERAFQLLTQVAGRAGRSEKPGEVIIQTYAPRDRAITRAAYHDYKGFFWDEIAYRKERAYPPFTHVIRALIMHEKEERAIRGAHELAAAIGSIYKENAELKDKLDVLGPAPAVMVRLKNLYRWQVSLKGKDRDMLRAVFNEGVNRFYQRAESGGISLNIEVDPLSNG